MLNFDTGFFAISDSSDRDPGSSRRFLTQFDQMIYDSASVSMRRPIKAHDFQIVKDNLALGSEKVLGSVMGLSSCTFTGLYLCNTVEGFMGLVLHTGDSDLYEYDPSSRRFSELTVKNFWMVGKTKKLFQMDTIQIPTPKIFILATDGVRLGLTMKKSELRAELARIVHCSDVAEIPQLIVNQAKPTDGFADDAAVIALASQALVCRNRKIIMGGI